MVPDATCQRCGRQGECAAVGTGWEAIVAAVNRWRFSVASEAELQMAVATALAKSAIPYQEQVVLAPGDRIDFLVGDVGVELKTKGGVTAVTRQLHRYAQHPRVASLILVTTMMRMNAVPDEVSGKPVRVAYLSPFA